MTLDPRQPSATRPPDGDEGAPLFEDDEDGPGGSQPETQLLVRATVTCFQCGRSAGAVETPPCRPWPILARFHPAGASPGRMVAWRTIRCAGCGGPTFLEDFETVRQRKEHIDWSLDAPRRGRPPAWLMERRRQDSA